MKLNATSEMMAITWPEFASLHPFVPQDQAAGYIEMFQALHRLTHPLLSLSTCSMLPSRAHACALHDGVPHISA